MPQVELPPMMVADTLLLTEAMVIRMARRKNEWMRRLDSEPMLVE